MLSQRWTLFHQATDLVLTWMFQYKQNGNSCCLQSSLSFVPFLSETKLDASEGIGNYYT